MKSSTLHVLIVAGLLDEQRALGGLLTQGAPGAYTITAVERADQALGFCQADPPDCLLLAALLPDRDLYRFLAELRAISDVPVVLLTDVDHEAQAVDILQQGAQDYLLKAGLTPLRLHLTIQRTVAAARLVRARDAARDSRPPAPQTMSAPDPASVSLVATTQLRLAIAAAQLDVWDWDVVAGTVTFTAHESHAFTLSPDCQTYPIAAVWETIYPPDLPAYEQAVMAAIQRAEPYQLQVRVRTPGGPLRWIAVRGQAQHDDGGQPVRVVGVTRDITAERWQVIAQARLDATFASVPNGLAYLDPELRYTLVNPAFAALHSQTPAALCDRALDEATPALAPQLAPLVRQVLTSGVPIPEIELSGWPERPGGEVRAWLFSIYPVVGPAGAIDGIGVIMVDLTQRKRTVAALRASEERFRLLAEHADDVILRFQLTPTFQVEYLSPAIERLTGLPREAFYADPQHCFALLHPDDRHAIQRYPANTVFSEPVVFRWRRPDGETGWAELHSWVVSPADSSQLVVEGIARDITVRQQAEDALRASEARYRTLFETMTQGVAYHDAGGRVLTANPAAQRILGLGPEQLHGYTVFEEGWSPIREDGTPFPKEDFPALVALRTGQVVRDVVLGLRYPGLAEVRWLHIQAVPLTLPGAPPSLTQVYTLFDDITAQRRAQRALEEERQQLAAILETLDEGVMAFQADGTLVTLNHAVWRRIGGHGEMVPPTLDAFHRASRHTFYDRDGRQLAPEEYPSARALRGQSFQDVQLRLVPGQDGQECWLSFTGALVHDAAGALELAVVTARNITVERQAALSLRESRQNLQVLIDNTDGALWSVDRDLRLVVGNAAFHQLARALIGREIEPGEPVVAAELPAALTTIMIEQGARALQGERLSGVVPIPLGGEDRLFEYRISPMQTATGTIIGVTTFARDITEQRQAVQALQTHHQQLAAILETLDTGVVAVRPDGVIALANPATQRHFAEDVPPDAPIRREVPLPPATIYGPDGALLPMHAIPFMRVMRGERFRHQEIQVELPGQTNRRWLTTSGAPVYGPDGALILGVLTADDITPQRHAEAALAAHAEALSRTNAELTRALQLKDEFLAMMSHELRTPLNVVLGMIEAMREELYGPLSERQRQALAQVDQSGRHLLAILSDILDLTHLQAGHAALDVQPIDVDHLCRTALHFVQDAAQQKQIRVLRTIEAGVVGLRADARRLTQILINLLDNAVKFTPVGGRVGLEVTAEAAHEVIQLVVWDTGIGIAEADYARLFQPFTQVDGRLSRQYGGIGLGLSLVRRLVDLHGGSISLASTPGQGSRFTVSLPWTESDNLVPQPALAAGPRPPTWVQPLRIVLADDHEITLVFYRGLLAAQGCQVTLARTGVEALAQVRATRPDVALLDIQMPELDGLSAIRQIRADPAVGTTPIIALTALAMPGDRERCLAAGANAYLAKPVSLRMLLATMAEVLPGSTTRPPGAKAPG